jgi:hypothetical protein
VAVDAGVRAADGLTRTSLAEPAAERDQQGEDHQGGDELPASNPKATAALNEACCRPTASRLPPVPR